jgi:prenyltransferase beta subunit
MAKLSISLEKEAFVLMLKWVKVLRESPVDWLLEESNPSVRYFTMMDVLGKSESDLDVVEAKHAIPNSRVVQKILENQNSAGFWEEQYSPYIPKYKASYWQIMILGQLGMDKSDARVRKACEHIFQFQLEEGGFTSQTRETVSREYDLRSRKGHRLPSRKEWISTIVHEQQLSCLTGNMIAALVRLGYADDMRVKRALDWLVKVQNEDGGWLCPYWRAHIRDRHSCFYGTICPLEAFSELNKEQLTKSIKKTVERGAEFLLMHRLFKADHHDYKIINRSWLQFSFPWFYGYNILRGLDVLTKLGYVDDERLNDAIKILMEKRQSNGKWTLENTPVGRMQTNIETKGKPSKWITLIALRVLKRLSLGK